MITVGTLAPAFSLQNENEETVRKKLETLRLK